MLQESQMKRVELEELSASFSKLPVWLQSAEVGGGVVFSTRIRFARNLDGYRFPLKALTTEKYAVFNKIAEAVEKLPMKSPLSVFNLTSLSNECAEYLYEKRVISRELIDSSGDRGAATTPDGSISIMINEEDHLRMQFMGSGFCPESLFESIIDTDIKFGNLLDYSYSRRTGFKTSCPTNTGTGMRISFLLHLPGLAITKAADKVLTGASQMGMATRGFFGEFSEVIGHLFQLSNSSTMGYTEEQFVEITQTTIERIIGFELEARDTIRKSAFSEIEDKIYRSFGLLSYARTLSIDELLNLMSALRLGVTFSILKDLTFEDLNELLINSLPMHLIIAKNLDKSCGEDKISRIRADYVRDVLSSHYLNL